MADSTLIRAPLAAGGALTSFAVNPSTPGPMVLNGDVLILSATTTDNTGSLSFMGRQLTIGGDVVPFQYTMTFSGTGTQTDVVAALTAGWILGFDVSRVSGTLTDGEVQASVHVGRNTGSLQQKIMCLASGEISNIRGLGMGAFNYGLAATTTALPTITTATVSNPAAGAEISVTVTAGQVWEIQGLRAILTTSGVAANREAALRASDGTNTWISSTSATNQAASTARSYNWGDFGAQWTGSLNGNFMLGFPRLLLGAGYKLLTVTSNIDAGDQWSSIVLSYRVYS